MAGCIFSIKCDNCVFEYIKLLSSSLINLCVSVLMNLEGFCVRVILFPACLVSLRQLCLEPHCRAETATDLFLSHSSFLLVSFAPVSSHSPSTLALSVSLSLRIMSAYSFSPVLIVLHQPAAVSFQASQKLNGGQTSCVCV